MVVTRGLGASELHGITAKRPYHRTISLNHFPGTRPENRAKRKFRGLCPWCLFSFQSLSVSCWDGWGTSGHFGVMQGNNGSEATLRCDLTMCDLSHLVDL